MIIDDQFKRAVLENMVAMILVGLCIKFIPGVKSIFK